MKTVFIIGAGASAEVGLPVGNLLKLQIAGLLNIEYDHVQTKGDRKIGEALENKFASVQGALQKHVEAARCIRNALPSAPSIDNFIDSHRGNESIELCAKLAIIRSILTAEKNSMLFVDSSKPMDFRKLEKNGLATFLNSKMKDVIRWKSKNG
ncbi:hypothetical protein K8S19_09170 [bacterium]|nr:hypothetical protein [bacterium]